MSERESEIMRQIEDTAHHVLEEFGSDATPEYKARLIGTMLGALDALFAIREGNPWRGIEDPREIARKVLHEVGVGE